MEKKRDSLQGMLLKDLKDAWNTNTALLSDIAHASFEGGLTQTFAVDESASGESRDFNALVRQLTREALDAFGAKVQNTIPSGADWVFTLALEQLEVFVCSPPFPFLHSTQRGSLRCFALLCRPR